MLNIPLSCTQFSHSETPLKMSIQKVHLRAVDLGDQKVRLRAVWMGRNLRVKMGLILGAFLSLKIAVLFCSKKGPQKAP